MWNSQHGTQNANTYNGTTQKLRRRATPTSSAREEYAVPTSYKIKKDKHNAGVTAGSAVG